MGKKRSWTDRLTRWKQNLGYFWDSVKSKEYWRYALISRAGGASWLAVFGALNLSVAALDFFDIYARDRYAAYAFWIFLVLSAAISILFFRRPITSIEIKLPTRDICIEVRIGDLFEATGAVVISSNTVFEADVANGKIDSDSLQGQFTKKYFPGDQSELINEIQESLKGLDGEAPYPMGTVVPINTHGKTFYFTAMAELNEQGNASTTVKDVQKAMAGLWRFVRESGELQELAVPVIGTGRGRLRSNRKRMILTIAESFVEGSGDRKISDKMVIVVLPEDAKKFQVNLWEIKDYLDPLLSDKEE